MTTLRDAALDLLLGSTCAGCGRPGRTLCDSCGARLAEAAASSRRVAVAGVGPPCWAAGEYGGLLRRLVLAHKERAVLALAMPLGDTLAAVVEAALAGGGVTPDGRTLALVAVPSRARTTRRRGHDPTRSMTRRAAAALRVEGFEVATPALLRVRRGVADQAGLGVDARRRNLRGAMTVRGGVLARLARRHPACVAVVVDDVVTSGATAAEAVRALGVHGVAVRVVATIAATPRRAEAQRNFR